MKTLIKKIAETLIKKAPVFKAGDQVRIVKTDRDAPTSIENGQIGTVKEVSTYDDRLSVKLDDMIWWFEKDGTMCGFEDCRIVKVTE